MQRPDGEFEPPTAAQFYRAKAAVLRAKVAMYEDWLREHHPDCPLLVENIVSVHRGRTDGVG